MCHDLRMLQTKIVQQTCIIIPTRVIGDLKAFLKHFEIVRGYTRGYRMDLSKSIGPPGLVSEFHTSDALLK